MDKDLLAELLAIGIVILIVGGVATTLVVGNDRNEKSQNSLCKAIAMERRGLGLEERVGLYKTCKEKF